MATESRDTGRNVVVLQGGTGQKQRKQITETLKNILDDEERVLVATGRYVDEVPMLVRMSEKRVSGYKSLGYS